MKTFKTIMATVVATLFVVFVGGFIVLLEMNVIDLKSTAERHHRTIIEDGVVVGTETWDETVDFDIVLNGYTLNVYEK